MSETSYEFDPCELDESEDEEVTLDNWKPKVFQKEIATSEWRQKSIGNNFNQHPGLDELKKIHVYLNKKVSDSDLMKAFGINAETLIAIKKNKYHPVDGISLDNLSKIYEEFDSIEKKIDNCLRAINYIASIIFLDSEEKDKYKLACKKPKKDKKKPKYDEDIYGEEE
jgi:DNA-binding Xre family transcriptional regulator